MKALTEHIPIGYRDLLASPNTTAHNHPVAKLVDSSFDSIIEFPSGRSAIVAALTDAGLDKDDRVILPGYTCHALVAAVEEVATPIFVDISLDDFTMDISKLKEAARDATCIVPVHLYGNPMDMEAVGEIANENDLVVIEDAAQAIGAATVNSTIGKFSNYCIFSFRFSKEVTTYRGGILLGGTSEFTTRSPPEPFVPVKLAAIITANKIFEKLPGTIFEPFRRGVIDPLFRTTGATIKTTRPRRFSKFQRRLLIRQLKGVCERIQIRRKHAHNYTKGLSDPIRTPSGDSNHTYFRYPVLVPEHARDVIHRSLLRKGIGVSTMYSYSVSPTGMCENADEAAQRVLILPVHASISDNKIQRIINIFNKVTKDHT